MPNYHIDDVVPFSVHHLKAFLTFSLHPLHSFWALLPFLGLCHVDNHKPKLPGLSPECLLDKSITQSEILVNLQNISSNFPNYTKGVTSHFLPLSTFILLFRVLEV